MLTKNFTSSKLEKIIFRSFFTSILVATGIFGGVVPEFSRQFLPLTFSYSASAQDFTQDEVVRYSQAIFEVEMLRKEIYEEIEAQLNETPPYIACYKPETLNDLSPDIRQIVVNFCQETIPIVRKNNLSISRFNELKQLYESHGDFYNKVQDTLREMQTQK